MKHNAEVWLKIVHEYLDKGTPMTVLSKHSISVDYRDVICANTFAMSI